MDKCHVCGNNYNKCFEIRMNNITYLFDCFECAIHALAPLCQQCGCKIVGHGIEQDDTFYCCNHCSKAAGIKQMKEKI